MSHPAALNAQARKVNSQASISLQRWLQAVLLLALLPIVGLGNPKNAWVLGLIIAIGYLGWRADGQILPKTPLNIPLFLIALGLLMSLYATYDLRMSYPFIAELLLGFAVFWWLVRNTDTEQAWRRGVVSLALVGPLIGIVALLDTTWPNKLPVLGDLAVQLPQRIVVLPRVPGTGIPPNGVAGALLWTLPLALSLTPFLWKTWVKRGNHGRAGGLLRVIVFALLAVAFPFLLMLLAQSRGALIAFTAALIFLMGFSGKSRWRLLPMTLGLVVAGALILVWMGSSLGQAASELYPSALSTDTLEWRRVIWSKALMGIADFPITGMGMNVFPNAFHVLYPSNLIDPASDIATAHNMFLQVGLDLGLIALAGYVAVWIGTIVMIARLLKTIGSNQELDLYRAGLRGLGAGLVGFLIWGLVDTIPLGIPPDFLWWAQIALVVSAYTQLRARAPLVE